MHINGKQACVFSLSLSNQELYARDKLSAISSAIIENCNGNLECHDENRTSALENMFSSPKKIVRRFLQLGYARIMPENIIALCLIRHKAIITS